MAQNWFKEKLEEFKDDFEFRLESLILEITENLCRKMVTKGLSRKELAERLRVSPPAVTKILNGNSNFTLKTLLSIADALDQELVVNFAPKERTKYHPIQDFTRVSSATEGHVGGLAVGNSFSLTSDTPLGIVPEKSACRWETPNNSLEQGFSMEGH